MGIKQIPSLQPTHLQAKPPVLPDDRTGKGSRSILRRESLDPFPDPYTDYPVADILPSSAGSIPPDYGAWGSGTALLAFTALSLNVGLKLPCQLKSEQKTVEHRENYQHRRAWQT